MEEPNYHTFSMAGMFTNEMQRGVRYLSEPERCRCEVDVWWDGRLIWAHSQAPVHTDSHRTALKSNGAAAYVMDPTGRIFLGSTIVNVLHHSSYVAGSVVAAAGEIRVSYGFITHINRKSGHFTPSAVGSRQLMRELQARGARTEGIKWSSWDSKH